jgi:catalase
VGGIQDSDGSRVPADQKIDGGPSVLYDAVVVLASKQGVPMLAALPAARDFIADAYAHCKFIGYAGDPAPLFEAAGAPPPASSPAAPSCGSGRARPASPRR